MKIDQITDLMNKVKSLAEIAVKQMAKEPEIIFCYGGREKYDQHGDLTEVSDIEYSVFTNRIRIVLSE